MNLNGDYISDALAAQVGGIGIAPGGTEALTHNVQFNVRTSSDLLMQKQHS